MIHILGLLKIIFPFVVRIGFEPVNTVYGLSPTALNKIVPDGILLANRELNASTIPPPD